MPIRFRCAYCNQLMGIATRKAGEVVSCPKCAGQVRVPTPEPGSVEEDAPAGNAAAAFEEDDEVQKLLEYVEETKPAVTAGPRQAPAAPMPAILTAPPAPRPIQPSLGAAPRPMPHPASDRPSPLDIDVVPLSNGSLPPLLPARGVYLTPGVLAIMLVLVGLLVGLAFFLGFLLGRS